MDRLSQADAVLADAASRNADVLLPGRVTSPMDCQATSPVARAVVDGCEAQAAQQTLTAQAARQSADGSEPLLDGPRPVMDQEMLRLSAGPAIARTRRDSA